MTPEERFNLWVIGYTSCAEAVTPWSYVDVKAAYLAAYAEGYASATEDAARIAEEQGLKDKGALGEYCFEIAAAIRGY